MLVSIRGSFRRSINLIRDFYSPEALGDYIVTSKAKELLDRVADALATPLANRAWSITGPYGGGKSAFALFMVRLLQGDENAFEILHKADARLARKLSDALPGMFCPILVVGSRRSLEKSLLVSLAESLSAFVERHNVEQAEAALLSSIAREAMAKSEDNPDDETILELYQKAAAVINSITGGGIVLVIDELGKFLEYAAHFPRHSDIYVLQRLAERASRTGATPETKAPLLVFTILHQAFERYASHLSIRKQEEWRKVQGRFEDFAFVEPVSEVLKLLAHAIQVNDTSSLPSNAREITDELLNAAYLPQGINKRYLKECLIKALPLHPAVSLIIGPLFRRLAQNERSLFAFLASGEPSSFLDIITRSTKRGAIPYYRLDHLYDYLSNTIGIALLNDRASRLWIETEAAIARLEDAGELPLRILKQIAVLSFAGSLAGVPPKTDVLYTTADAPKEAIKKALDLLVEKRVVIYRAFKDEYHIWQGSDFDLDKALEEAREHVSPRLSLANLLSRVLSPSPVIAHRHSYRTGTTRVFEVCYASDEDWHVLARKPYGNYDGRILYIVSDSQDGIERLLEDVRKHVFDPRTLLAIPESIGELRDLVYELACLKWIREHARDLKGDDVARREVDFRIITLEREVERQLSLILAPNNQGIHSCIWVHNGKTFALHSVLDLQNKVSDICDEVFSKTPVVWNELVNRHKPSASAMKGLKALLEAIIERGNQERLGIEKYPPEYAIYASILLSTGIHRPKDESVWEFGRPDDEVHPGCAAVWDAIVEQLDRAKGRRVPVQQIYDVLLRPPYGVREGLIPVFLFAVCKAFEDEIAFYENGVFQPKISYQVIERFLKNPDRFELQKVAIKGGRREVLRALAPVLGMPESVQQPLPLVLRVLERIHNLPPYVRKTTRLSQRALSVREAVHHATEPMTLLFEDLPLACGLRSFLSDEEPTSHEAAVYATRLGEALQELSGAYESLLVEIQEQLAHALRLQGKTPEKCRQELAERAAPLLRLATDMQLKAFLVRATDTTLDTQGWYESLAALLAKSPPIHWNDESRLTFRASLMEVARRFLALEPIAFDLEEDVSHDRSEDRLHRVRLSVTMLHEEEQEHVIAIHPEDSDLIMNLYGRLKDMLADEDVTLETKLAALAKLTNELLSERSKETHKKLRQL